MRMHAISYFLILIFFGPRPEAALANLFGADESVIRPPTFAESNSGNAEEPNQTGSSSPGLDTSCVGVTKNDYDSPDPDRQQKFIHCTGNDFELHSYQVQREKEKAAAAKSKLSAEEKKKLEDAEKNISKLAEVCEKSFQGAKSACLGTQISPLVQAVATQFEQSRTNGDIAKACAAAKRLNAISVGANLSVGVMCHRAYPKCTNACSSARSAVASMKSQVSYLNAKQYDSIDRNLQQCSQYKDNVGATYVQGLANVSGYAQSQQCLKAIALTPTTISCEGETAKDNPACIDKYCAVAGREKLPICVNGVAQICADPSMAQNLFCRCQGAAAAEDPACKVAGYGPSPNIENPLYAGGGGGGGIDDGSGGGVGTGTNPNVGSIGGNNGGIPDLPDLPPDAGQQAPLANNDSGAGGGLPNFTGGNGVGGGGFSGGSGGANRKGSGGDDEEEASGAASAGGGGQPDGPLANKSDGDGSSGGLNGSRSGSPEENTGSGIFDLSAYLPKDESRLPASGGSDLLQYGISEANGLSNWEKVTRKLNEKRRELRN